MNQKAYDKIQQRRLQMLIHSYIYYVLDDNIISDATWSRWAKELSQLQKKYPKTSKKVPYYKQFKNWDGSTGAFLDFDDITVARAEYLLYLRDRPRQQKPKKHTKPVKSKAKKKKLF